MKAVALTRYLAIEDPASLIDVELQKPVATGHDLLVRVEAIGVNPLDCKVRAPKDGVEPIPRVLGWDVAGVVDEIGSNVTRFKPGDAVFYAGNIMRAGANSEYHLVDERIVGRKPVSLDFTHSAALPLTAITAWQALFARLRIPVSGTDQDKSILIIGGAGGVGSIAIQLAKRVAKLKVIATASRPDSVSWARNMGADHVIDHFGDMVYQSEELGFKQFDYVLILNDIDRHFATAANLIKPQGSVCSIVENTLPIRLEQLKPKSASFHWESMFTRPIFATPDMVEQHYLLNEVARLIDAGVLTTTLGHDLGLINAVNLRKAHRMLETGRSIGKIALTGFDTSVAVP